MKPIILFTLLIIAFNSNAQNKKENQQDSLIWYFYIGGKPDMKRVNAEKKVAASWGITTNYFFGDCGGTYDYKNEEFEKKNQPLYIYLIKKHGKEWEKKFEQQVNKLLKED